MPFLHANLQHIVSNTLPLFILLILLAGSKANSWSSRRCSCRAGRRFAMAVRTAREPYWSKRTDLWADCVLNRVRITGTAIRAARHFDRRYLLLRRKSAVGRRASIEITHFMGRASFGAVAGGIIAYLLTRNPKSQAGTIKYPNDES